MLITNGNPNISHFTELMIKTHYKTRQYDLDKLFVDFLCVYEITKIDSQSLAV